ncbi:hypothetical protein JCM15519_27550 [Fundidesulfovibrio butyratiphilus]
MPWEEKQHDMASFACHTLEQILRLATYTGLGDEFDREAHEAFTTLSCVPDKVREQWMCEYGILEAAWLAWATVARLVANAEGNSNV